MDDRDADGGDAEFGPAGYLPSRAAHRARKIVLRERMGLQWPVASVVAGVLILLVVIPLVLRDAGPPGAPFVEVGPLDQVDARGDAVLEVGTTEILVVRGGGVLSAFADPPGQARFCPASRRIEDGDGNVWSLQGRRIGGTAESLRPAGVRAVDEVLYVDPTSGPPALEPAAGQVAPTCS